MPVQRFDRSELKKPKKTREGFLRADAYLGREGIQKYRRADGSEQLELRPPEEVFKPEVLESFALATVTRGHPPRFVTTDNWRSVSVGSVGDTVVKDGAFMRASLLITDAQAIADLESGEKREVSGGYTCDLDETPGEWKGQHYDCVQRNIVGNHVALVKQGRAGPEVRVRLDAADAIDSGLIASRDDAAMPADKKQCPECKGTGMVSMNPKKKDEGESDMVKMKIDGVEYEVSEQAKQALEREAGRNDAQVAALKAATEAETKAKAEAGELQKKLDAAEKAKADAVDPEKVQALVRARVALCTSVAPILGEKVKLDELSERDIQVALIKKSDADFKAEGKSDEYVAGRFDEALRMLKKQTVTPIERARGLVMAGGHEDEDVLDKALSANRKRNAAAARADQTDAAAE